jgi:hypothetical protein
VKTDCEEKLERVIRLQAIALVDGKTQREQIRLLSLAGFPPKDIAKFVITSRNTVNVEISKLRNAGKLPKE